MWNLLMIRGAEVKTFERLRDVQTPSRLNFHPPFKRLGSNARYKLRFFSLPVRCKTPFLFSEKNNVLTRQIPDAARDGENTSLGGVYGPVRSRNAFAFEGWKDKDRELRDLHWAPIFASARWPACLLLYGMRQEGHEERMA
jgi:hypothetical protein